MALYCDKCNNLLDVSRSSHKTNNDIAKQTSSIDYDEIIRKIENNEKISNADLMNFDMKELIKNDKYTQTQGKGKIRKILANLLDNAHNSDEDTTGYLLCENCGFNKKIDQNTVIFTKNSEGIVYQECDDYDVYRNMVYQRTLPRTRNFKCPNKTCPTNTDKDVPTEACFFRKHNSYVTIMICTTCHTLQL